MPAPLGRILTAMVTPFAADGALDLDEARAVARYLVRHGSEGLVVHGTTGEAPTLSDAEKLDLVEAVAGEVGGEVPVVAGTGTYDTAHSVHLTREAVRRGADAILAVTPYYNKPPADGIYQHFRAVAEAAGDRPVILYNIPQRVVLNMEPALLGRIAGDRQRRRREAGHHRPRPGAGHRRGRPPRALRRQRRPAGAVRRARRHRRHLRRVARRGRGDARRCRRRSTPATSTRARAIEAELAPLLAALSVTTNPIPVKAAMELLGFPVGPPRLPLVPATEAERAEIRGALERRGLLARASSIRVIPLGGVGEIGKNMTVDRVAGRHRRGRRRHRLPPRRDARRRPRAARPRVPARPGRPHARRDPHARPRGPRRRPAVPAARGRQPGGVGHPADPRASSSPSSTSTA